MTIVMAIDPGPVQSAFVQLNTLTERIVNANKFDNGTLRILCAPPRNRDDRLAIEMIASYGMPVGAEVFQTCVEIGRFIEAWGIGESPTLVYRKDVKLHLCGQTRAKDSNIRQALIDRWGGKAATKKGGALSGIKADMWSALAVAVTWSDLHAGKAAA